MKIGVMFGNPETTSGGRALKFYSSVRLDIRRTGQIKDDDEVIGNETRVKVVKNKVAAPFRTAEFEIMYNEGISKEGDILNLAEKYSIIDRKGSWYTYGKKKLGQGSENAKQYLRKNEDVAEELEEKIKDKIKKNKEEKEEEKEDK